MSAHQSSRAQTIPQFAPAESPLRHMIRALENEIEAVKRSSRANIITVADGIRESSSSGSSVYRFALRRGMSLRDDANAQCTLDDQQTPGVVLSTRDGELVLSVPRDFGPIIRTGRLTLDNTWLLAALQQRLHELLHSKRGSSLAAVDRLLGRAPIASGFVAPPVPPHLAGRQVLAEQQQAVGTGLGSDTLYIWGPAGTGKSTTVADLIAALMPTESTLLVAPTNAAVDCALLKLVRSLGASHALARGEILRLGPIVDDRLRTDYGDQVSFDAVVERRRRGVLDELAQLDAELTELDAERVRLDAALRRPEIGTATSLNLAAREATRTRLGNVLARLVQARASERVLQDRLARVASEVLNGCRVLATTVHRAFLPDQFDRDFDAVVIDEAGAVMLPMAMCAAARATKRVICAGDFRQLAAPVHARTGIARAWLARDVFALAGIPALVDQGRVPAHLVMLRRQFRMAPAIRWLVNQPVYGGALIDDDSVVSRPRGPLGRCALIYVDTSTLSPRAIRRESGTRTNALHAFVVRALIAALCHEHPGRQRSTTAIVTPYRGQVELIRRQLAPLAMADDIDVATAHRFQGGERGIIVADLCDAPGVPLGHFMKARSLEDEASKLLNVMFTRAQQHIVLVAPFGYLLKHAPADGLLHEFLTRFQRCGRRVDLKELLSGDT